MFIFFFTIQSLLSNINTEKSGLANLIVNIV